MEKIKFIIASKIRLLFKKIIPNRKPKQGIKNEMIYKIILI